MAAMTMQVVDTGTLPYKDQIQQKKEEIRSIEHKLNQMYEWLKEPEHLNRHNYNENCKYKMQIEAELQVAMFELEELMNRRGYM